MCACDYPNYSPGVLNNVGGFSRVGAGGVWVEVVLLTLVVWF